MTTISKTSTEWMTTEEKVLSVSDHQLQSDVPQLMRLQGFTDEEIQLDLQIVIEFRDRHKLPVIE